MGITQSPHAGIAKTLWLTVAAIVGTLQFAFTFDAGVLSAVVPPNAPSSGWYWLTLYSYGLYSYGLYSYGLHSDAAGTG